ncbi:MAG: SurA N-terminal domain-containing protein [Anaerolineae bacterium]|jgi:foldase protein PrsA
MAKSSRKRKTAPETAKKTKKQIALGRKEARQNRIILILVGALIAVIVLILAVGVIRELVLKPSSPVATVNGEKIRTDDYQNLVTYNRYNYYSNIANLQSALEQLNADPEENEFLISFYEQQLSQLQSALTLAPQDALDELIDAELARQKAEQEGIQVTAQEVDQAIDEDFRSALTQEVQQPITATEQLPTSTPVSQEEVDELYSNVLSAMQLSDEAFRTIVQRSLMLGKVQDFLASEVPTTGLVADVELIQTEVDLAAIAAKGRIERGEDFAIVAQEVSTDTVTAENGGAVGWVTPGQLTAQYGADLDEFVFELEVGELGTVESDGMYYVVRVLDRDENGPLPEEILTQRQNSALNDWLEERKASPDVEIERMLDPDQIPPDPFTPLLGQ